MTGLTLFLQEFALSREAIQSPLCTTTSEHITEQVERMLGPCQSGQMIATITNVSLLRYLMMSGTSSALTHVNTSVLLTCMPQEDLQMVYGELGNGERAITKGQCFIQDREADKRGKECQFGFISPIKIMHLPFKVSKYNIKEKHNANGDTQCKVSSVCLLAFLLLYGFVCQILLIPDRICYFFELQSIVIRYFYKKLMVF